MPKQLSFPAAMMRTSRLLAKVLLWEAGELDIPPADVLVAVRALRARLLSLEQAANEAAANEARAIRRVWNEQRTEVQANGDATQTSNDEEIPW